jgi:hypothetical protein
LGSLQRVVTAFLLSCWPGASAAPWQP